MVDGDKECARGDNDKEAIEKVIVEAYINGIHRTQDECKIRSGFHSNFGMLVLSNNDIEKVNVSDWLSRIEKMKKTVLTYGNPKHPTSFNW